MVPFACHIYNNITVVWFLASQEILKLFSGLEKFDRISKLGVFLDPVSIFHNHVDY